MNTPKTIHITNLHPFEGHPYQVRDDEEMDALVESIREHGILTPLIVRPMEDAPNEYEVISGHRRLHAAQKAGISEVPAFIHAVSREEAAIQLVDSNLHRERLLPSEKAFAYKLKIDALNHRGQTCGQVGHKSRDGISDTDSGRQVQRYIRLTHLLPGLLTLVDEGRIAFTVAVELSYLTHDEQCDLVDAISYADCTPSIPQAQEMRRLSQSRTLCPETMTAMLSQPKPNQKERISFKTEELRKFFPKDSSPERMQEIILKLLADYDRNRRRAYER